MRNGRLHFLREFFSAWVFRAHRIFSNLELLKFCQRIAEVRQVLFVTDPVFIKIKLRERLSLAFEALDLLYLIVSEVEHFKRRQLAQALNFLDLVVAQIQRFQLD